MASTRATISQHLFFEDAVGTVNVDLIPVDGDVYIDYNDPSDWVNDQNYSPQFSGSKFRLINFVIISSTTADLRIASATWTFNGADCTTQPQYFETNIINNTQPQLKIKGNIAKLTQNKNIVIKCEARIGPEGSLTTLTAWASYTIYVRQRTQDTYRATIAAINPASNFTIGADGAAVGLRCHVYDYMGNAVNDPNLSYQWKIQKVQDNSIIWENLGTNSQDISVGGDKVNNQALIGVDVSLNNKKIASDTQVVYDSRDPFMVKPTYSPEDCIIRRGDPTRQRIVTGVDIVRASDGSRPASAELTFFLYDSVGNEVQDVVGRRWENIEWVSADQAPEGKINYNSEAFVVTADDFINGGKEIVQNIIADIAN